MKLHVEHLISGVSLNQYIALHFDEEFNVALCKATNLQRGDVSFDERDGIIRRTVHVTPERAVPAPIRALIGSNATSYTEHVEFNKRTATGTWRVEPGFMADKIISKGTLTFREVPGGVMRIVDGDVDVKIFALGGTIASYIVEDATQSYALAADFTNRWIRDHAAVA